MLNSSLLGSTALFRTLKVLILDLETTVQRFDGKIDNSPFNPDNRCVSAHFHFLGEPVQNLVFHHNEKAIPDSPALMRSALEAADVIVCHNAKFDVMWLTEMGFHIPPRVYCTMIGEYVLAKGQRQELSLKATAERRNVTRKKSDLVDGLFRSGTGFEAMPLETVLEYAEADVVSCGEIYQAQLEDFDTDKNKSMMNIVDLMNEMLLFLVEIERNGIKIDAKALEDLKIEFTVEHKQLSQRLNDIVDMVMGDTPINLNSGADMTKVVYSREVIDRNVHQRVWNIGVGANGKPLYPPRMNASEFARAVRATTTIIQKTDALCCDVCDGRGKIHKFKKDGDPFKNQNSCPSCGGVGAFFKPNGKAAGLRLNPEDASYASINGFKTDKTTIKSLIKQAELKKNDIAIEFLTKMSRLNALSTYLDSFIKGIETWTRPDGILHTQFNQCITATGRLSSTTPNLQNMPKRGFPVRKAVISRFENGEIIEIDYSGIEFVMAGELSRDPQIISDVMNGKDLHKQTASIIYQCSEDEVSKDLRQASKKFSFAPIYGGLGVGEADHVRSYFTEFFNIYKGLGAYHQRLAAGVLKNGHVQIFSGRQFYWPNVKRLRGNRTTNYTQIVNYPVQSAATADIVPLACIRALRRFKELGLRSKLILTVHDSLVCDVPPEEVQQVREALIWATEGVVDEVKERWGYEFALPLKTETSHGINWLDQAEYD